MNRFGPVVKIACYAGVFALATWVTVQLLSPAQQETVTEAARQIHRIPESLADYSDKTYLSNGQASSTVRGLLDNIDNIDIIDVHEHVQFAADGERLLEAMDRSGIQKACLLGTPLYTFTLSNRYGFEKLNENNQVILELKKKYPGRFCVFVAVDPDQPDMMDSLQRWFQQGADGVKLYLGHGESTGKGPFHTMPLDDEKMLPLYRWADDNGVPLTYHVNLIKFYDEFDRVMQLFPNLRVNLPHFGLHSNSWARLSALGALLDRYPNLYFDMSYGWYIFHIQGFENLARNRTMLRAFIERYSDRVLFGSDSVGELTKSSALLTDKLRSYRYILESPDFQFYLKPEKNLYGLQLSVDVLEKIYTKNPNRFINRRQ